MNAMIGTDKQQLGNSSCRCNLPQKMLAIAIPLRTFSCRGYGKLVVAIQLALFQALIMAILRVKWDECHDRNG